MTMEHVDTVTGEVIDLTEAEARRLTERIRTRLDRVSTAWADLADAITEAYQRRADLALGYGSWAEYAEAELKPSEGLAADVRRQLVGLLSARGMSTRAIAPTVGVTRQQVARDQVAHDVPPATDDAEAHREARRAELAAHPPKVTGIDGKTYPRLQLKPIRREPLPETFWRAVQDLRRRADSVSRLIHDDRFDQNRDAIASQNAAWLNETASTLAGVLAALHQQTPQEG